VLLTPPVHRRLSIRAVRSLCLDVDGLFPLSHSRLYPPTSYQILKTTQDHWSSSVVCTLTIRTDPPRSNGPPLSRCILLRSMRHRITDKDRRSISLLTALWWGRFKDCRSIRHHFTDKDRRSISLLTALQVFRFKDCRSIRHRFTDKDRRSISLLTALQVFRFKDRRSIHKTIHTSRTLHPLESLPTIRHLGD
jgi:hypothetical protein